jgi:hypothetical protein
MKFIESNTHPDLLYHRISEDGKLEIGVWPVIYGYRVRAGHVGDQYCHIDYCAGDQISAIQEIYSMVMGILSSGKTFKDFPRQQTKPMYNDPECTIQLWELCKGLELEKLDFSDVHLKKMEYYNRYL